MPVRLSLFPSPGQVSLVTLFYIENCWVFWDRNIAARENFPEVLERELASAKCVVVLWSQASVQSSWVKEEAYAARDRNVLFSVLIDEVQIPFGYRTIQAITLTEWQEDPSNSELKRLVKNLNQVIGQRKPIMSIAIPDPNGPITDEHLTLVHSSWRVPQRDAEFQGQRMYRIHVIVFGVDPALDRIERVRYFLDPAYPNPIQESTDRERNFELKELANGYSVIRAEISVKNQVDLVRLSRFINLTETGPRLDIEFMSEKKSENNGLCSN